MKLSTIVALVAASTLPAATAESLRATCQDAPAPMVAPTETPALTPTETPAPTTETPAPTETVEPLEDPVTFFSASGVPIFRFGEPPINKCFGWGGCFRQELAAIRWQALGPKGTTIRFYTTSQCQGDEFVSFPVEKTSGTSPLDNVSAYRTFVVVSASDPEIDRSDAFGCRK